VNIGRSLAGQASIAPKHGARFHFDLPGAVQGFRVSGEGAATSVYLENVEGHSADGQYSLAIRCLEPGGGTRATITTPTFIPADVSRMRTYDLLASPTLYSGQTIRARLEADGSNGETVACRLIVRAYGANDSLETISAPEMQLTPGDGREFVWRVGDTRGAPIAEVGFEVGGPAGDSWVVYIDYLTWDGAPDVRLTRPVHDGTMWRRAWVDGMDQFEPSWPQSYRLVQNEGTGLIIQGGRDWLDYRAEAEISPHFVKASGMAVRVQGMRRYYALLLTDPSKARLVKVLEREVVLAEADFEWEYYGAYTVALEAEGSRLRGWIDDRLIFDVEDAQRPLLGGGVALVATEGCFSCDDVSVRPLSSRNPWAAQT
jgi:hypothetical protein